MAGQNQEIGVQGSTLTFDVFFRAYNGGPLIDPDPAPTYTIKDPSGAIKHSATGVKVSEGSFTATYDIPIDAQTGTTWKIEWTAYINGVLVPGAWEYFIVVEQGSIGFDGDILISDKYFEQIKTIIGYPHVDLTEGDKPLITNMQIRTLCIEPALREYFKKFPKREITLHNISSGSVLEIDFLNDNAFGVSDIKIISDINSLNSGIGGGYGFWEMVAFQQNSSSSYSKETYGIKGFNPSGLNQELINLQNAQKSQSGNLLTEMIDIDTDSKKIIVHTNQAGTIQVDWALYSNNFGDVKFQQIENVIKLSQSYLAKKIVYLASLMEETGVGVGINTAALSGEASSLENKVFTEWSGIGDRILFKL